MENLKKLWNSCKEDGFSLTTVYINNENKVYINDCILYYGKVPVKAFSIAETNKENMEEKTLIKAIENALQVKNEKEDEEYGLISSYSCYIGKTKTEAWNKVILAEKTRKAKIELLRKKSTNSFTWQSPEKTEVKSYLESRELKVEYALLDKETVLVKIESRKTQYPVYSLAIDEDIEKAIDQGIKNIISENWLAIGENYDINNISHSLLYGEPYFNIGAVEEFLPENIEQEEKKVKTVKIDGWHVIFERVKMSYFDEENRDYLPAQKINTIQEEKIAHSLRNAEFWMNNIDKDIPIDKTLLSQEKTMREAKMIKTWLETGLYTKEEIISIAKSLGYSLEKADEKNP